MRIDSEGWLEAAGRTVSPNADDRPSSVAVDLVVIHAISLPPGEFGGAHIAELFQNRLNPDDHPYFTTIAALRVSAHFLVGRGGAVTQFVSCERRAWHAGVSSWRGRERCNDFSIGIELEGTDDLPFEDSQYAMLDRLLTAIRRRYPIRDVVGHSDVAPGRKTDPGPCFDWGRVSR